MAERITSLLHFYKLRASQTQRLPAHSDLHAGAHVRMHPEDIETIARPANSLSPMVALFSTARASEPVCLRTTETVYVRPGKKTGNMTGKTTGKKTEHNTEWVPLRVSASHAYVRGL